MIVDKDVANLWIHEPELSSKSSLVELILREGVGGDQRIQDRGEDDDIRLPEWLEPPDATTTVGVLQLEDHFPVAAHVRDRGHAPVEEDYVALLQSSQFSRVEVISHCVRTDRRLWLGRAVEGDLRSA